MGTQAEIATRVIAIIQTLRSGHLCDDKPIEPNMSVLDLGLDSLKLMDLTVALEDAFNIPEFPIQAWIDDEAERVSPRYTVSSLIERCQLLISPPQHIGLP